MKVSSIVSFRVFPALACGLALLVPAGLEASGIEVLAAAANTGAYGARVTLAECGNPSDVNLSGAVSSDQCSQGEITTSGVTSVSGDVSFTAGNRIVLGSGFSTAAGASFAAIVHAGLTLGDAYLQDDSPDAETRYAVRYDVRADGLLVGGGEEFAQLVAYDAGNAEQFWVVITHDAGLNEDRVYVAARAGGGGTVDTSANQLVLPSGYNAIELEWIAGSTLTVCVNDNVAGANCESLTHNNAGQIDYVRWGAPEIRTCSSCGAADLDNFDSRKQGPIGP